MHKNKLRDSHDIDSQDTAIPFTARLNAYYRAQETRLSDPLITDPFAERLAGDMTGYFDEHKWIAGMGGTQIVRSYYIENELLSSWCATHEEFQIVLLGAGLDTRAYRFRPLQGRLHTVFEVDLPIIISYKEQILQNDTPLCALVRIPADLSDPEWFSQLVEGGFSEKIPTFWILEGLLYYIEQDSVISLLKRLAEVSTEDSQLFVDVCVPALADLKWGPFSNYFIWGIPKDKVSSFFATAGWNVSSSFIDDHARGRDVGQRGLILVHGVRSVEKVDSDASLLFEDSLDQNDTALQSIALSLGRKILLEISELMKTLDHSSDDWLAKYLGLIKKIEPDIRTITRAQKNPALIGLISPRLLGDPYSIEHTVADRTRQEIISFIIGFLQGVLQLIYCGIKGLQADQYPGTRMHEASKKLLGNTEPESLSILMKILEDEVKD
ncbi:MAG: class I SAM-dependent methyltransferase [Candidatus Thorarchaeota archaeon]|nr:class I SAM-dependent methyltransferase [Candidatus Thorarchaeota archaeon]